MILTRLIGKFSKMMTVNNYADIFCTKRNDFSKPEMADLQIQNKLLEKGEMKENISQTPKNVNWIIPRRGLLNRTC